MTVEPGRVYSAFECWKRAGGGAEDFDQDEYMRLMCLHGHVVNRGHGVTSPALPCGWKPPSAPARTPSQNTAYQPPSPEHQS